MFMGLLMMTRRRIFLRELAIFCFRSGAPYIVGGF
jgi:hypothetical protein